MKHYKIIFFGTSEFALPTLEKLINESPKRDWSVEAIVTVPDKSAGRGQHLTPSPVKAFTQKYQIKILQPQKLAEIKSELSSLKPDLFIIAAYGKILPNDILDISKYGTLNVHPSLLPKYRGPSPIQATILNGDQKAGVTIMLVTEKIDAGPILSQKSVTLTGNETALSLSKDLAKLGADLLIETSFNWLGGKIKPQAQDESRAVYTKMITKEDGRIDWNKSAEEIERQIRAMNPWPGAFSFFQKNNQTSRLNILNGRVYAYGDISQNKKTPGRVFLYKSLLAVETARDCLVIEEIQIEGGKSMPAQAFLNGHRQIIGQTMDV